MGTFEQLAILAILRLSDNAYGVAIRAEIVDCTGRSVAPGALYTTLERLESKGYVTSQAGDPTPERGGRSKRFYTVTPTGLKAVRDAQTAVRRMMAGLKVPGGLYA